MPTMTDQQSNIRRTIDRRATIDDRRSTAGDDRRPTTADPRPPTPLRTLVGPPTDVCKRVAPECAPKEWQHLNAIRRQCVAAAGSEAVDMRHCPGFAQHQGSEHAAYLQQLEDDFRCTGFCRFWAPPLFVAGRAEAGKRCASALGAEVQRVGHLIAWPVVASGAVVIFLGAVLGAYEHL